MRALITGAAGFVGSHLADVIHAETDWQVWGTILGVEDPQSFPMNISMLQADLRDPEQVRGAIEQVQPDCIFHLAGQAYVPQSWNDPWGTYETNIRSQLNLLHAVSLLSLKPKIMTMGSNEEYGWVSELDLPIAETTPLRPNSPYSVSKIAQDFMGLQYFLDRGLPVVRVRPFNHIGPRQNDRFVAPSFAKQIVEIEAKFLAEVADGGVALIDEFPSSFCNLAFVESAAEGPAAPACARACAHCLGEGHEQMHGRFVVSA